MRRIIFILISILPLCLLAEGNSFLAKGGIGSITMGDEVYNKVNLSPELSIWKLGLGLNIELLFNKDGKIYEEDWDEVDDYVEKILYFRFAQKGDPFYFLIGNIESYTLGNGLIMKDYSNMLLYPETKKLGGMVGMNLGGFSAEFFSADVVENDIVGARIAYAPFSRFQIGVSGAADLDQYNGISDQDGDGFPDAYDDYPEDKDYYDKYQKDKDRLKDAWVKKYGTEEGFYDYFIRYILPSGDHKKLSDLRKNEDAKKEVYEAGFDYTFDICKGDIFSLKNYGEVAKILDHGYGFVFPGVKAKLLFLEFDFGYRQNEKEFMPQYFDALYDQNRVKVSSTDDSVSVITKQESLENISSSRGWQGSVAGDFFDLFVLKFSYSDMQYGDNDVENAESRNQGMEGVFSLNSGVVPKISAAYIKYKQENEPKLFNEWKTENTFIEGKISLAINESSTVNWLYTERYKDLDGNGKISGKEETISNVSFGLEMTF